MVSRHVASSPFENKTQEMVHSSLEKAEGSALFLLDEGSGCSVNTTIAYH